MHTLCLTLWREGTKRCGLCQLCLQTVPAECRQAPAAKRSPDSEQDSRDAVRNHSHRYSLIPENTEVYVSPYILHTDERYFSPATMEFRPERWLESGWNTNRAAFIPFSYGPAQCVGKNLARIEIVMVLSALLHRYDMSFAPGYDPAEFPEHLEERLVVEVPRLPIALKRRKL